MLENNVSVRGSEIAKILPDKLRSFDIKGGPKILGGGSMNPSDAMGIFGVSFNFIPCVEFEIPKLLAVQ